MARYGDGEIEGVGSFWVKRSQAEITREHGYADPIPEHSDPTSGILNLRTKARMNVPFGMFNSTTSSHSLQTSRLSKSGTYARLF